MDPSRRSRFSLLPVFAILILALAIFFPILRNWAPVEGLLGINPKPEPPSESAKVWVNTRSGLYYCSDSKVFGKITPGEFMTQGKAVLKGYRPSQKEPCR